MPSYTDAQLREILGLQRIGVVGCSSTPGKDAHDIPKYLLDHGYEIVPINPNADEIFGTNAYDSLGAVDRDLDIVNVFRPSDELPDIADAFLARDDATVLWTQLGIRDTAVAERVDAAGRIIVQDRCLKVEHRRLHR